MGPFARVVAEALAPGTSSISMGGHMGHRARGRSRVADPLNLGNRL